MCFVAPSHHPSSPARVTTALHNTLLAMPTGTQPPLAGDVAALTARLDGLSADQNPEDISRTLGIAFEGRELYNRYLSSLDGDVNRVKALLEVFDKVHPENVCYYSVQRFSTSPHDIGTRGT